MPPEHLPIPASLKRRWGVAVAAGLVAVVWGVLILAGTLPPGKAIGWGLGAALALTYVLGYTRRHLHLNRPPDATAIAPTLGAANVLTLGRGIATALLGGFLLLLRPAGWLAWAPGSLFLVVAVTDFLDGYLARRTRRVTLLGERLDLAFDALGMLIAVVLVVQYGQAPGWFLLVGLAYYLFVAMLAWRRLRGLAVHPLPPSDHRRLLAGFLYGFVAVILFPVFMPPATVLAAYLFGMPVLAGFGRDALVTTGVLDANAEAYRRGHARARRVLLSWMPLALRAAAPFVAAAWLYGFAGAAPGWGVVVAGFACALLTGFVIWGYAGRLAALGLLALACLDLLLRGFNLTNACLLVLTITLLLTGTGSFSRWQPEDVFLLKRRGGDG